MSRHRAERGAGPGAAKRSVSLSTAWSEARELIVAHRARLLVGLALLPVSVLAGQVLPWSFRPLFDEVFARRRGELLLPIAIAIGLATLVQAGTGFALARVLGVAAQRAINDMRKTVQAHVTRLPVRFFDSTQSGQLISRIMTDAEGVRNLVGNGIVQLVGGACSAGVGLALLFWLNWRLTTVILVLLAVFGGCLAMAFTRLRPLFRERGKINAEVTGRLGETLGGIRIVKAYVAEPREQQVFAGGADRLFRNVASSITGVSAVTSVTTALIGVVGAVLLLIGGRAVLAGTMTTGDFMWYLALTALVSAPVMQIASIGTQITEAFAGLDRIREIRRLATEEDGDATRADCPPLRGEVAFRAVGFAYDPGRPVLADIDLLAPAGSTIALVGPSGSGKSTLVSLVMAFNRPQSGTITVDGLDLGTLKLAQYRAQLGVVAQDNFLFDGTVAENIGFSRPDATREQVLEAARLAHCEDFVSGFPQGYDTVVGERGVKLSGGQRQRIAIARALLAQPRILILDEATSSLDSESEAQIQAGLQELRRGRTTFVIAHRLSTIRSADQILVLEQGRIVERGTHAALMAAEGRYRQLHDKQYQVEQERYVNPGEELRAPAPVPRVTVS